MSRYCPNEECPSYRLTGASPSYGATVLHCAVCGDVLIDEEGYRVERRQELFERAFRRAMRRRFRMFIALFCGLVIVGGLGVYVDEFVGLDRGTTAGFATLVTILVIVILGAREAGAGKYRKRERTAADPDGGAGPVWDGDLDVSVPDFGGDGGGD